MCVTMLLCAHEMHNLLTRGKHLFEMPGDVLLLNVSYAEREKDHQHWAPSPTKPNKRQNNISV